MNCIECGQELTGVNTWWLKTQADEYVGCCSLEHVRSYAAKKPCGDVAIEHDSGTLADIFKRRELAETS